MWKIKENDTMKESMIYKEIRREEEGYFTVEAAWIGSFSCILFLFIMVVTMYFYDVGVVTAALQEDVIQTIGEETSTSDEKSVNIKGTTKEGTETTKKGKAFKAEQRVILSKIKEYSITTKGKTILGKATISVGFPIPVIQDWLGKTWEHQIQVQMEEQDAPNYLRKYRQIP